LQEKKDLIKHYENYNVGGLAPEDDAGEESGIQGIIDAVQFYFVTLMKLFSCQNVHIFCNSFKQK